MKKSITILALIGTLSTAPAFADDGSLDAAIGGGLGGAVGAYVGNELGGRKGAVIGAALGAVGGAAITTEDDHGRYYRVDGHHYHDHDAYYRNRYRGHGYFCPPGQAKKGRC